MAESAIAVPPLVRQKAMSLGEPGRRWLAERPRVIASLQRTCGFGATGLGMPYLRTAELLVR
jgi:hypothetical protein